MRKNLMKVKGLRKKFQGTFVRYGYKYFKEHSKKTLLLKEIKCTNNKDIYCGHIWLNMTKELAKLDLNKGDIISFDARIKEYHKGYRGYREEVQLECPIEKDYKLTNPTKVKLVLL